MDPSFWRMSCLEEEEPIYLENEKSANGCMKERRLFGWLMLAIMAAWAYKRETTGKKKDYWTTDYLLIKTEPIFQHTSSLLPEKSVNTIIILVNYSLSPWFFPDLGFHVNLLCLYSNFSELIVFGVWFHSLFCDLNGCYKI